MRVVLDTNVVISGAFFSGPPSRILDACLTDRLEIAVSLEIVEEYSRVGSEFSKKCPNKEFESVLAFILGASTFVEGAVGSPRICSDPDDDKFLHCALAAEATHIVSGDKHLLEVSGYAGVQVIRPREFMDTFLCP